MNKTTSRTRRGLLVLLAAGCTGVRAQGDAKACAVVLLPGQGTQFAALARKLQSACAPHIVRPKDDVAKLVKDLRRQGVQRIVLAGDGSGASAVLAYAASPGDIDGVIALGGDAASGDLPRLAPQIRQNIPLLWVVGSGDPLAAQGEGYAYAKAPPHPASRFIQVKADAAGTPEAASKAVLEWLKSLE